MIETVLFAITMALIVGATTYFGYKANKSVVNVDGVQLMPKIQKVMWWVFFVMTALVVLTFVFIFIVSKTDPTFDSREPLLVNGVLSILFVGILIWLKKIQSGNSYYETSDHFVLSNQNKIVKMNYLDIEDYSLRQNYLTVYDRDNKAKINLMWFRPTQLLNMLIRLHHEGRFEYLDESYADSSLKQLEDQRKASRRD